MTIFKVGDFVEVIKEEVNSYLFCGERYVIREIGAHFLFVKNDNAKRDGYFPWRFKLIARSKCYKKHPEKFK